MSGTLAACGDVSQPRAMAPAATSEQHLEREASAHAYMFACSEDYDCIAVPKAGLCRNGVKEAINRHHSDAYQETFSGLRRGPCTFLLIRDRRVARCDKEVGRCTLVIKNETPRLPPVFTPPSPGQ